MTAANVQRHLLCARHGEWAIDVGANESCPVCGYRGEPICACGCRASLSDLRSDAVYHSEACAKRLQRHGRPDTDPTGHPLDEARATVEEGKDAAHWALVAREHTMRTLLETGYFTADDLEPLGIPAHHRRSIHGLVTAYFRGPQPYMEEAGRRKSERPERKGAKNTIFRISAKGRRELPKLLEDTSKELAGLGTEDEGLLASSGDPSAEPGEKGSTAGVRSDDLLGGDGPSRALAPVAADSGGFPAPSDSRGSSEIAAQAPPASEDAPAQLFQLDEARPKPRSAISDPEWGSAA